MNLWIDCNVGERDIAESVGARTEIDIIVFDLAAPVAAQCVFDTGTCDPAEMHAGLVVNDLTVRVIEIKAGASPRGTTGHIRQPRPKCVADASPRRAEVIEGCVERCRHQLGAIERAREGDVGLDAEQPVVRQLQIVTGLVAADQARDAVRKKYALLRQRICAGTETAAAVTCVSADIEAAPVEDAINTRCLDRECGGDVRRTCRLARHSPKHQPGGDTCKKSRTILRSGHDGPNQRKHCCVAGHQKRPLLPSI